MKITKKETICQICGAVFIGGFRAKCCPSCRRKRQITVQIAYHCRRKQNAIRKIGSTAICKMCGGEYIVGSSNQQCCAECRKKNEMATANAARIRRREERRAQPIDAGKKNITVKDIASRLGVSIPLIYYHIKRLKIDLSNLQAVEDFIVAHQRGEYSKKRGRPPKNI